MKISFLNLIQHPMFERALDVIRSSTITSVVVGWFTRMEHTSLIVHECSVVFDNGTLTLENVTINFQCPDVLCVDKLREPHATYVLEEFRRQLLCHITQQLLAQQASSAVKLVL